MDFYRLHDLDGDYKLDGLEILKAWQHHYLEHTGHECKGHMEQDSEEMKKWVETQNKTFISEYLGCEMNCDDRERKHLKLLGKFLTKYPYLKVQFFIPCCCWELSTQICFFPSSTAYIQYPGYLIGLSKV